MILSSAIGKYSRRISPLSIQKSFNFSISCFTYILQLTTVEVYFVCEVVICAAQAALGAVVKVVWLIDLEPLVSHNLVTVFNYFQKTRGMNYVYIT